VASCYKYGNETSVSKRGRDFFFSLFIEPRKKEFPVLCYFYNDLTSCTYIYAHELTLMVYVSSDLKIWIKQNNIYVIKYVLNK